ncbi:MAG: hypothetical protein WBF53_16400 [Litorimonas sp.]
MTDHTTARSQAADHAEDTVPVPENPTQAELKGSLEDAEFPRASHMAKEIFGESPKHAEEEE